MTSKSSQVSNPSSARQRHSAVNDQVSSVARKVRSLFPGISEGEEGMLQVLLKSETEQDPSSQGVSPGRQIRPYNFKIVTELAIHNPHHSTCIQAKVMSTTGLGHVEDKVDDALNSLCSQSWQSTLTQLNQDLESSGNAYLEVVREKGSKDSTGKISGLYFVPADDVEIIIENGRYDTHFELNVTNTERVIGGTDKRKMAKFGDLSRFLGQHKESKLPSEIIHFALPSNMHRFYGYIDWIAAVAYIELVQAMVQHQFDFHLNRGVPEFMLFMLGAQVQDKQWRKIEAAMNAQIGMGNTHKSIAVNIANPNIEVQLEKLALEGTQDGAFFRDMLESLSTSIVSAHRVPPSLAGILIAGKMGASNETTNALMAFQALVVGPRQKIFTTLLDCSLGNDAYNGDLGLSKGDFKFRTITEEMAEAMEKLAALNTMGGMKSELPEATSQGRDLKDGLRD